QLPSAVEKKTRQETDLLRMFVEAFATRRPHPDDVALARRVLTHDQAEVIIAGLLRDHLGVRPDALEEATAARRARGPTPTQKEPAAPPQASAAPEKRPRPEPAPRRETREQRAPREESRRPDARPGAGVGAPTTHERGAPATHETADEPDLEKPGVDGVSEIYVSVGRRDGAKPSDYQTLLESAGVTEDEVGYVRVR